MFKAPTPDSASSEYQALLAAIKSGDIPKIKEILLGPNGNVELVSAYGNQPIRNAALDNQPEVIKYLLDNFDSVDPNALDNNGKNALSHALDAKCLDGFKYILQSEQFNGFYFTGQNDQDNIKHQNALNSLANQLILALIKLNQDYWPYAEAFFNDGAQCVLLMAQNSVIDYIGGDNTQFMIFHKGLCQNPDGLNDLLSQEQMTLEDLKKIYNKAKDVVKSLNIDYPSWGYALSQINNVIQNPPSPHQAPQAFTPTFDHQKEIEEVAMQLSEQSLDSKIPETKSAGPSKSGWGCNLS